MTQRLLVLWDPANPILRVRPLLRALSKRVELVPLTFSAVAHQTLPNGHFDLAPWIERHRPDGLLWIEGGPLPGDLADLGIRKACWLPSLAKEPTLIEDLGPQFDVTFVPGMKWSSPRGCRWLPPCASDGEAGGPPARLSIVVEDPKPPEHARLEQELHRVLSEAKQTAIPVVFCPGLGGEVSSMLFEALASGAAVVADSESDYRGLVHLGEHLEVFPSKDGLAEFALDLLRDEPRLAKLAARGPAIVEHLHTPDIRAAQLVDGIWPIARILGGQSARPHTSVLVTCYRYLKRFRFCLESLARQDMPPGSLEIVVTDPQCPDGLADYLVEFASRNPHLRVVHRPLALQYHRNRGVGINRAFDVCSGEVIIGIDGDIVFPPHLIALLKEAVSSHPEFVYGVRRIFLSQEETESILKQDVNPIRDFHRLSRAETLEQDKSFIGVLGYCQAVSREAFAKARYPEEFDMVNQSDIVFVERLFKEAGVTPRFLADQTVLHLWHPRNWSGTTESL